MAWSQLMNIRVEHISAKAEQSSGYWRVSDGKNIQTFHGPDARADAQDYARQLADDARWHTSNRG